MPKKYKTPKRKIKVLLSGCIKNAGSSYSKIRDDTGISISTLSRINKGHVRPSVETIELLCDYLVCELNDLLKLE